MAFWKHAAPTLAAISVLTGTAAAQAPAPGWSSFEAMRQHFSTRAAERAVASPDKAGTQISRLAPPSTSFQPQDAELAPALMAAQGELSAADQDLLRRQLSDHLATYRERLRVTGGEQNNVARAAAYLFTASYQSYFGRGALPEGQFAALRRQFELEFSRSPDFQTKDDRDRQIEFELYAILGTLINALDLELRQDPSEAKRSQLKSLAHESFTGLMGVPPERVAMSQDGYRVR